MNKQLLTLAAILLPIVAMAGGDVCINSIYYNLDTVNKTAEVSKNQHYTGTEVIIPESFEYGGATYQVTSIRKDAFNHCSSFTSLTIPNSVTQIGAYAFLCCKGITSATVSKNVITIGECAFSGCSGLTSLVVESGNPNYDSRNNCNAIIETATNTLLSGCKTSFIPDGVLSIADYAFYELEGITAVSIPSSVVTIGKYNFYLCPDLASLSLTNGLTSVGELSFAGCNYSSLTIPQSLTSIGSMAFLGSPSLASVVVENGNPNYDSRNNCNCIIETTTNTLLVGSNNSFIPDGIAAIGPTAFYGYSFSSINIPSSVTSIGDFAFKDCKNLTTIHVPNSVTSIGGSAFQNCSSLTSITLPHNVISIGDCCFGGCSSLSSIILPNNLENIGVSLFGGCKSLTTLVIPDKVKSIGSNAFNDCTELASVTIGKSVETIDYGVFYNDEKLTKMTCLAPTPPVCNSTFYGFNQSACTLSVSPGCKAIYQQADYWKEFFMIDENATKIDEVRSNSTIPVNIYNFGGRHQGSIQNGVNIVRLKDGTTRKVVVK